MATRHLILILVLLAACAQGAPPRGDQPISIPDDSIPDTQRDITVDDAPAELPEINHTPIDEPRTDWRDRDAVVMLVSDGQVAARAYLLQGDNVTLELSSPVSIRVEAVGIDEKASLILDGSRHVVEAGDDVYLDSGVIVHVYEVIDS